MSTNQTEQLSHKQQMDGQHFGWVTTVIGLAIVFHGFAKGEDWYEGARARVRQAFSFSSHTGTVKNASSFPDTKASGPRP